MWEKIAIFICDVVFVLIERSFCRNILTERDDNRVKEITAWVIYFVVEGALSDTAIGNGLFNMVRTLTPFFILLYFLYSNSIKSIIIMDIFIYKRDAG